MQDGQLKKQSLFFDVLIVVVAVTLLALTSAFGFEAGTPPKKAAASVWLGLYIIYLGVLFLLSYFFSRKSYVLGGLMWVCENFSRPRSRHMAFFYFALGLALGLSALLFGLGVL
jgi:hypothetical protein